MSGARAALHGRPAAPFRRREAVVLCLLLAVGVAVWGRTLNFAFVWDDQYFVVTNLSLRSAAFLPRHFTDPATAAGGGYAGRLAVFRPIRNVSYFLDFSAWGLDPRGWHAHNVALHLLNALLVFAVARRLSGPGPGAAAAAAVFLLHPAQTEAVAWVKCRDDLLAALFSLLSLLAWLRWRARPLSWRHTAALGSLYALACLSKEQAVALPLLWMTGDLLLPAGPAGAAASPPRALRPASVMAFAAVCAGFLLWRHAFLGRTSQADYLAGGFAPQMLTMLRAAARYIGLLVCPWNLLADYSGMEPSVSPADPRALGSAALLLAVALLTLRWRRARPAAALGLCWTALLLAPVSNVVPMMQFMAERFLYLPMAGYALCVGELARAARDASPRRAVALVILLSATAAAGSARRADVWRDSLSLFAATVRDSPPSALRPRENLLVQHMNAGDFERALPLARGLLAAARADPAATARRRAEHERHVGFSLLGAGRGEEGLAMIRAAALTDPSYAQPLLDMAVTEGLAGRHEAALELFDRAAALAPGEVAVQQGRGIALRNLGRAEEAEAAFRLAIGLGPEDAGPHRSLAALLWGRGRRAEAAAVYEEALRLWPRDAECRRWLHAWRREQAGR
jgi:tetratricopeptide (TPR) repeat protein